MEYHSRVLGLVTKHDPGTENGGTFLCHEMVMSHMLGKSEEEMSKLSDLFYDKMLAAKIEDGLYMRSLIHTKRTVSHDELTSFFVCSYLSGSFHRKEIWNYMLKNFGVYSFSGGKRNLPFQPAQYYSWSKLADSKIPILFLPFFILSFLIAIHKKKSDTSSKLLYLDELYALRLKGKFVDCILWRVYVWKMKRVYGDNFIKGLIEIYFHTEDEDYPLKKLAKQLQ